MMKRDVVCCLRLMIDSIPSSFRNSRIFFEIARILFRLPPFLFYFREKYKAGLVPDLSSLYDRSKACALDRISSTTDINSMHMNLLKKYTLRIKPNSFLDAGCGSGYLIKTLSLVFDKTCFVGVDYQAPTSHEDSRIDYRTGDLLNELQKMNDNSIDFVVCAHVIEHLADPKEVIRQLKRISLKCFVVICPLEKEFKWGMNYHVNFFPDKNAFSAFLTSALLSDDTNEFLDGVIHERLGDVMYVETYG